mgnify:CR=1 FL=1|tara:strand:- start:530 stop:805 length:276 start_codon:yes stop_codon:yes gene_type:complete
MQISIKYGTNTEIVSDMYSGSVDYSSSASEYSSSLSAFGDVTIAETSGSEFTIAAYDESKDKNYIIFDGTEMARMPEPNEVEGLIEHFSEE